MSSLVYSTDSMILNIKTNDLDINYFKFGSGSKIMVILPGVSTKSVMESKNIIINEYTIFEKEFSIYVFDRINNMKKNYSIYDMAIDTIKAFEYLNLNNIYLFGASQGGMISLVIAYKRPDLIKKLNVNSITYKMSLEYYSLFDKLVNLSLDKKYLEMLDLFSLYAYTNKTYELIKDSLKVFANNLSDNDIYRFIIECEALKNFDITDILDKINVKTLIIAAKLDKIFNYNDSIYINNKLKNSKIYIYEEYSHDVYDEAKDIKNKIYDFFMED